MKKITKSKKPKSPEPVRLQKYLSMAGVASRRAAEALIEEGKVRVNGKTVTELGTKVDPEKHRVSVSGKPVNIVTRKAYYLFYKPVGCLTTVKDDQGRPTIFHYLKKIREKVFPVGRLDFNTEGLLILTNDGDLANIISHPSRKVEKTYLARVRGIPEESKLKKLERGVILPEGGKTAPLKVSLARTTGKNAWVQIKLTEGKNRQIHQMCELIGHPVSKLKRIKIGFLDTSGLRPGDYRSLSEKEIYRLKSARKKEKTVEKTRAY